MSKNDQELFELLRRRVTKPSPATQSTEPLSSSAPAPPAAPPPPAASPVRPSAPPSGGPLPPPVVAPPASKPAYPSAQPGPAAPAPVAVPAPPSPLLLLPDEAPARAQGVTAKLTGHKSISLRFDFLIIVFIAAVVLFLFAYIIGHWQGRRIGQGEGGAKQMSGARLSPENGEDADLARRTPPPEGEPIGEVSAMQMTRPGPAARIDRTSNVPAGRARFAIEVIRFRRNDEAVARERVDELKRRGFTSARCVRVGREWIVYVGRFRDANDRAAKERRGEIRSFERTPGHFPYRKYGEIVRVEEGR